ncbi:JAB domain-containing protein [Brevundimonas aurifodinae]|uniref:DNA repair protein RadC n=2 Tax=Brevundimonas TaxID=41275 RepID=A0ABV1NM91_9CAUL|nr:MAG: hypothetical protein B7Z42_08725 [Brevundimonas sp. 12-68-7]OYX34561.1 MAG: hypothetical protein B7Z01_05200 [Brevundimonas subvibrioides]
MTSVVPFKPLQQPRTGDRSLELDLLSHCLASFGLARAQALSLSAGLLDRYGSLGAVITASEAALRSTPGMSPGVARGLVGLYRLTTALSAFELRDREVISSAAALEAYVRTRLRFETREQVRILYLDHRNHLIRDEGTGQGTVNHAPVYAREVIRRALELSASALILAHNHPSGDPTPSRADIAVTRHIAQAAGLFGLQVHDHLIVGRDRTASLRALGLM